MDTSTLTNVQISKIRKHFLQLINEYINFVIDTQELLIDILTNTNEQSKSKLISFIANRIDDSPITTSFASKVPSVVSLLNKYVKNLFVIANKHYKFSTDDIVVLSARGKFTVKQIYKQLFIIKCRIPAQIYFDYHDDILLDEIMTVIFI